MFWACLRWTPPGALDPLVNTLLTNCFREVVEQVCNGLLIGALDPLVNNLLTNCFSEIVEHVWDGLLIGALDQLVNNLLTNCFREVVEHVWDGLLGGPWTSTAPSLLSTAVLSMKRARVVHFMLSPPVVGVVDGGGVPMVLLVVVFIEQPRQLRAQLSRCASIPRGRTPCDSCSSCCCCRLLGPSSPFRISPIFGIVCGYELWVE